jgi:hypothetical protein
MPIHVSCNRLHRPPHDDGIYLLLAACRRAFPSALLQETRLGGICTARPLRASRVPARVLSKLANAGDFPMTGSRLNLDRVSTASTSCPDPELAYVRKERQCLVCQAAFISEWSGERVCSGCKKRAAWRSIARWAERQGPY